MGELFAEVGDLVFTLVIGYISAIEFLYVVRHLYHYSCNHDANEGGDSSESLSQLQGSMQQQLADAKNKEDAVGTQVMKDGVRYKEGYRLEAQEALIEQLKEQLKEKELSDLRRQELEKELAKQKKIAEQLRKELAEAEAKYQRQLKQEEEIKAKKLLEEQKHREQEQRQKIEAEEEARRLVEAEKEKEAEQRKREEEEQKEKEKKEREEQEHKTQQRKREQEEQKEKQRKYREELERIAAEEQARKLVEAEKQKEAEQRKREEEEQKKKEEQEREEQEKERKYREELERIAAEEQTRRLVEVEKQKEAEQRKREEEEQIEKEKKEREEQRELEEKERNEKEKREREEQERIAAEEQFRKLAEENELENLRQLQEAEKQREMEQRLFEEEQEERDRQREEEQSAENYGLLLNIEKDNEKEKAAEEAAAELAAKNFLAIEHHLEEQLRAAEREAELTEKERQLIDTIKKNNLNAEDGNDPKDAALLRKILDAREQLGEESEEEQSFRLIQRERDQEAKQRRIEENALLFMEAEKEMMDLQSKIYDAVEKKLFSNSLDNAPTTPVVEEPCIKRSVTPLLGGDSSYSTVKTQLGQDLDEAYSVRTKALLFPGVSDDASSIDPASSQKSSFSTQPSEEITTGTDSQYPPTERQEPDGEDTNLDYLQYSDDYLRSLDGIKQRPLLREDGSGRRRAFKKRRSSNGSNSSRESRHSRDEEVKMFTSLEEEEMKYTPDTEFTPIRYTTDPTLKVKGHHRRHKRSPAKDTRRSDDSSRSSLERLGEETTDPWGEVKPELYKHTEFWKREKNLSIDEELEYEKPASSEEVVYDTAANMPSASSFEEANEKQNQEALTTLQQYSSKKDTQQHKLDGTAASKETSARSDNANLQSSQIAENEASSARSPASPRRLRRSPRIEEISQYEQRWEELKEGEGNTGPSGRSKDTPTISVQAPLDFGPWRDDHGLIMEGLSDFYDFQASVNPSRSRSVSRNVSPANTAPNTPFPKNVSNETSNRPNSVQIFDDTGNLQSNEFKRSNIIKFIDSLNGSEINVDEENIDNESREAEVEIKNYVQYVADDHSASASNATSVMPLVNIIDNVNVPQLETSDTDDSATNAMVCNLRTLQTIKHHSRSKSPLPTPDNLKRSVENRRYRMIKHNEDVLEKLIESKLLPDLAVPDGIEQQTNVEQTQTADMSVTIDNENHTLQIEKRRSRSKSPMRLPTPENLNKGLEKRRNKLIERNDEFIKQLEERSLTPESPTVVVQNVYEIQLSDSLQSEKSFSPAEEEDCSREKMDLLVQSLRAARSRTRSKSPRPMEEVGIETPNGASEVHKLYNFERAEYDHTTQHFEISNVPTISIIFPESGTETEAAISQKFDDDDDCSREKMGLLIQSLREARSRSTSKSPMVSYREDEAKSLEKNNLVDAQLAGERSRHSRSQTPSRSHSLSPRTKAGYRSNTPSRSLSPQAEDLDDFHVMLNLEASSKGTLSISGEEQEFLELFNRQRQVDDEALETLRNPSEEMELRVLSPFILSRKELTDQLQQDQFHEIPLTERAKLLRKSPATPDYDRTISEEMRDVERIKQDLLQSGFKRSTYVGESMDLGSEFEPLRRETAKFQRSRSPSPSFSLVDNAQKNAEEKRKIQDLILKELNSSKTAESKEFKNTGAIPKSERFSSNETDLTRNNVEITNEHFEQLRRRNAEFRRSTNTSRSPLREAQLQELASIEKETAKRVFKDKILDEVSYNSRNFADFSRGLNATYFANDRRASDSALIKMPEISAQYREDMDMEPEEYHHFRRFSLAQEDPVEQYPSDDYIFIEQVEVRTRSGSRTWLREDFYSENVGEYLGRSEENKEKSAEREDRDENNFHAADEDEDYSNASDDDRQTVVEVDDEIDEDISDFNERGTAEESHHETSECEEAEREMDRYAGREASDWNQVIDADAMMFSGTHSNDVENDGAVGGVNSSPYDSDSFAIDQIYDDAIKNRKQSGILREYDSLLVQMSMNNEMDTSKINDKRTPKNIEYNKQLAELRYLGDSNITARQSMRLRSRYGYSSLLPVKCLEDDSLQPDMNYKPKKEYNWRKNFKLDEEIVKEDREITLNDICHQEEEADNSAKSEINCNDDKQAMVMESNKLGLGSESTVLFSPEITPNLPEPQIEVNDNLKNENLTRIEGKDEKLDKFEKPKKKKTKKKSHKESKASLEETMNREDEDAYDHQVNNRRSSSLQMDMDSPKRKSHSRRSSKSSLTSEDALGMFSPRSSVVYNEATPQAMEEITGVSKETARPKKMKKRKKVKETMANVVESPIEIQEQEFQCHMISLNEIPPVSTVITPDSSSANILSTLSPQDSICVTPASIDTDINLSNEDLRENPGATTTSSSSNGDLSQTSSAVSAPVDSFDILKDASFYPLF